MTLKLIRVFTGLMIGYLVGMMSGFRLFHPGDGDDAVRCTFFSELPA